MQGFMIVMVWPLGMFHIPCCKNAAVLTFGVLGSVCKGVAVCGTACNDIFNSSAQQRCHGLVVMAASITKLCVINTCK
jgi:hypothetical protein